MLNPEIFQKAMKHLNFKPYLDCYGWLLWSRLNIQLPQYISYKPGLYPYLTDFFSVHWGFYKYYLFPPFSLTGQTLQKICMDRAEVILAVPKWLNWHVVTPHKENYFYHKKQKNFTNTFHREGVREVFLSQGLIIVLSIFW